MLGHTEADARFVARCGGMPLELARADLRRGDDDGLGWIQLAAMAIPLIAQAFAKKKKGPSAEQVAAQQQAEQQRQAAFQQAIAQRDNALRQAQLQQAQMAAQLRNRAAPPSAARAALAADAVSAPARPFPVAPVAIGGGVLLLAAIFLMRK